MELRKNHVLQGGKYRIIEKIGQGGFAITYKANFATEVTGTMGKITTNVTVAIKEFFFADYCVRDSDSSFITVSSPTGNQIFGKFKEKLRKEATILSRLRHPNIVSVFDIFEENNTIYMVMEYIDGFSLKQTIINQGGHLNEATTLRYASQLCEAVAEIHRNNVLHLDIKPGNILIDNNDNVKLIDFGISKQYNSETHTETSTTPVGISKGFAPLEQYTGVSQFSPATDIYAIGATIYNMLSGQIPPESMYLLEEDLPRINGVSNQMWTAITSAMQTRRNQRPQTVSELINLFPLTSSINESPTQQQTVDDEKTQICNHIERQHESTQITTPLTPPPFTSSAQPPIQQSTSDKTVTISDSPHPPRLQTPTNTTPPSINPYNDDNNLNNKTNRKKILIPIIIILISLICIITVRFLDGTFGNASTIYYGGVDSSYGDTAYCDTAVQITPGQEIDLGLPSGIIWAGWNVGAESAEQSGNYYAWGETKTKDSYTDDNYITLNPSMPLDITGTKYDVAHIEWGENWRMPTAYEFHELRDYCQWHLVRYNGISGWQIIGPNGNSIFFPLVGIHYEDGVSYYEKSSVYWSSTSHEYETGLEGMDPSSRTPFCTNLAIDTLHQYWHICASNTSFMNSIGASVRPVKNY